MKFRSCTFYNHRSDKSIKELVDLISAEVGSADTLLKSKLQTYNATKAQLVQFHRKTTYFCN